MDNEMIKRAAKACFETLCPGIRYTKADEDFYEEAQLNAIKAMRDPTAIIINIEGPDMPAGGSVAEIWISCIDAIIGEE